jgi:hypothetical protein
MQVTSRTEKKKRAGPRPTPRPPRSPAAVTRALASSHASPGRVLCSCVPPAQCIPLTKLLMAQRGVHDLARADDLPDLALFTSLSALPAADLARAAAVCTRWRDLIIAEDARLWRPRLRAVCPVPQDAAAGRAPSWRAAFAAQAGDLEADLVSEGRLTAAVEAARLQAALDSAQAERDSLRRALAAVAGSASVPALVLGADGVATLTHAPALDPAAGALAVSHMVADVTARLAGARAACDRLACDLAAAEAGLRAVTAGWRARREGQRAGRRRPCSPPRPVGRGLEGREGLPPSVDEV